jgi:chromosome segregation ATPase
MTQILKRLELIKTAISIEDEEIIELQLAKFETLSVEDEVKDILHSIQNNDYENVIPAIEKYIAQYNGVIVYDDKELQGLRLELKIIEKKLQELSQEKNEYLNNINGFNIQYNLKLGDLIEEILNIRQELLHKINDENEDILNTRKKEYSDAKDSYDALKNEKAKLEEELDKLDPFDDAYDELYEELNDVNAKINTAQEELNEKRKAAKTAKEEFEESDASKEYEEAKQEYEEFSYEHEELKKEDIFELSDEEAMELKQAYRKASKLCHPDIVIIELKEQAQNLFIELNSAYSKKDLQKVKEILLSLDNGHRFDIASDTITDKVLLKSKIAKLRDTISAIEKEIDEIITDDTFLIIDKIENWDEYFSDVKEQLQEELDNLTHENNEIYGDTQKNVDMDYEDGAWSREMSDIIGHDQSW